MPPKGKPLNKTVKRSSKGVKRDTIGNGSPTKRSTDQRKISIVTYKAAERATVKETEVTEDNVNRSTLNEIKIVKKEEKPHDKESHKPAAKPAKQAVKYKKTAEEVRLEEAIAEIVLKRTSSYLGGIDEEESVEEEGSSPKEFQLLEHPSKFMVFDVESEESSTEEPEYLAQPKLESQEDFFETLGFVPEVEEVSSDVSVKEEKKVEEDVVETLPGEHADTGKFVNPLTGEIDTDGTDGSVPSEEPADRVQMQLLAQSRAQMQAQAQSRAQLEAQPQSRVQLQAKASESSSEDERRSYKSSSSGDFSDTEKKTKSADALESSKSDVAAGQDDEQDAYLQFLILQEDVQKAEADLQVDVVALLKEQERLLNLEQTADFLNNLIELCVQKAEFVDENVMLRRNLDKGKVIEQLKEKLKEMFVEKKKIAFLNRKCMEHFHRKGSVRQMQEDDKPAERKKVYYSVLRRLDYWLKREQETKVMCTAQKKKYKEEYKLTKENIQIEIQQLEQCIKSTFHNEKYDKLTACVKRQVEKMSTLRHEIAATRLKLFLEQHIYSELSMELAKLEDLGNGLNLKDYDNLETETKALGKKVEERNNVLRKLHHHYDASIHSMAHLKEKKSVLHRIVEVQTELLTRLQNEKNHLRNYISQMKRQHNSSRYEIKQLSFQSGLLDKPNLMVDYDRTVEMANKLKRINGTMKQTIESLRHKIALLEKNCIRKNSQ